MLDTNFTRLIRVRYPIVQAPIGSATTPELTAAVSNAGALGTLSITWRPLDETRRAVERIGSLTYNPFAVNVVLVQPQEKRIAVALEAGAKAVWTFWGDPSHHVAPVHAAGGLLLHQVGSVEEAQAAVDAGVDVLIAQGVEAGGHVRGTIPWRAFLAAILETVREVPVLVAGGIADANDIAAALAAGASGACLGTRFVCSKEANVADIYQQRILAASSGDTVLTSIFDKGWPDAPHRVLRNSTVRMWEAAGRPAPGARPGEHEKIAVGVGRMPVERYSDIIPVRGMRGDLEALALYAGESSARIHDVRAADDIVQQLVRELQAIKAV